jgi:TPR repeat protein
MTVSEFISNLLNLNVFLANKIRATQAHDEALAYGAAGEHRKAAPLLKEAAGLGNPDAMAVYGSVLLLGKGVPENGIEAVKWLQMAVDRNQADAASVLGMAYATGKAGVKPNHKLARELLTKAAAEGDEKAAEMLDMMDKKKGIFKHLKG